MIRPLTKKEVISIGSFDKANRFYPYEEYIVENSFCGRSPSRAFPYSFYKHALTLKYAKLLAKYKPELYKQLTKETLE